MKAFRGGYLRVSAATVRVSLGFQGFPEGFWQAAETVPQNAVWIGVRRLCHAAKTKKEYKGSGAYMSQVQRFSRGISGLVVEYIVAIWPGFDSRLMHIVLMSRWERVRWRGEGGTRSRDWQSHDCLDWNAADLQKICRRAHFPGKTAWRVRWRRHATWNSRSVGYPHHSLQVDTCEIRTHAGRPHRLSRPTP